MLHLHLVVFLTLFSTLTLFVKRYLIQKYIFYSFMICIFGDFAVFTAFFLFVKNTIMRKISFLQFCFYCNLRLTSGEICSLRQMSILYFNKRFHVLHPWLLLLLPFQVVPGYGHTVLGKTDHSSSRYPINVWGTLMANLNFRNVMSLLYSVT